MSLKLKKVGFLGCGHMGQAILSGLLSAHQVSTDHVFITARKSATATAERYGVQRSTPVEILSQCEVIFLGIKPQQLDQVQAWIDELQEREPEVSLKKRSPRPVVISMLAGVSIDRLRCFFSDQRFQLARVMPNLAVQVQQGVTLCCGESGALALNEAEDELNPLELCTLLFKPLGHVEVLNDEALMHAATAISGCGPAYLFNVIEALADGGVHQGLKREVALRLAAYTVAGSGALATQDHPALLKDRVTSPAGVTIEGIRILEASGVRSAMIQAVIAATQRSRLMCKSSD